MKVLRTAKNPRGKDEWKRGFIGADKTTREREKQSAISWNYSFTQRGVNDLNRLPVAAVIFKTSTNSSGM